MPKTKRVDAPEAEKLLLKAGFVLLRIKGSHRIYKKTTEGLLFLFIQK